MNNPEPVIPAGWRLVPIEPTEEMRFCGKEWICNDYLVSQCYRAMLAAAPPLPAPPGSAAEGERMYSASEVAKLLKATGIEIASISEPQAEPSADRARLVEGIPGLLTKTDEDDGRVTLQFNSEFAAQEFMNDDERYGPTVDRFAASEPKPQEGNHHD